MAMGYLDTCTSVVLSHARPGIYSICFEGYREYGDYLHCGGTLECFIDVLAVGSCWLLYDRLLYGGLLVHRLIPVGGQEKLYTPMAAALSILLCSPCFGFRRGPIQNNHMDQAGGINECIIFASILR